METNDVYELLPAIVQAVELEGHIIAPICSIGENFYYVEVGHLGFQAGEDVGLGAGIEVLGVPVHIGSHLWVFVALRRGRRVRIEDVLTIEYTAFELAGEAQVSDAVATTRT